MPPKKKSLKERYHREMGALKEMEKLLTEFPRRDVYIYGQAEADQSRDGPIVSESGSSTPLEA